MAKSPKLRDQNCANCLLCETRRVFDCPQSKTRRQSKTHGLVVRGLPPVRAEGEASVMLAVEGVRQNPANAFPSEAQSLVAGFDPPGEEVCNLIGNGHVMQHFYNLLSDIAHVGHPRSAEVVGWGGQASTPWQNYNNTFPGQAQCAEWPNLHDENCVNSTMQ